MVLEAARRRQEQKVEPISVTEFEDFLIALRQVGDTTVEMARRGTAANITGMALDFYARAIQHQLEKADARL
jgi:hypothetical protein